MNTLYTKKLSIKFFLLVLLTLAFLFPWQTMAAPGESDQPQLVINKVYITNIRDSSFNVSWATDGLSDGSVAWGPTPSLGTTVADTIANTSTHYVEISPLNPSTQYYFQVTSGGVTDPTVYTVITGPTLDPNSPGRSIQGTVYEQDGVTPVPNAIVYIQVQDNGATQNGQTQWGSVRTDATGYWNFSLNNLRQEDLLDWFFMNNGADILKLIWQGGIKGAMGESDNPITYTLPSVYPATFNMNLDGNPTAVSLVRLVAQTRSDKSGRNFEISVFTVAVTATALLLGIIKRIAQR